MTFFRGLGFQETDCHSEFISESYLTNDLVNRHNSPITHELINQKNE